jgi:membrane-associated protease RseP (regulator of RpoE activity)
MNSKAACLLIILLSSACVLGSEKCSTKEKDKTAPEHHRGWIGGQYKMARRRWSWSDTTDAVIAFPKSLTNTQKGILITSLSTNTPAYLAGLREADLILEFDHQKIKSLADFRRRIDQADPGASLAVQIYRHGELKDCAVTVGRETFCEHGNFAVAIPLGVPRPNLKFNPSFSLLALGLTWQSNKRTELDSAEETFRRENEKEHYASDPYWHAWAGPIFVSRSREIRTQEIVPAE